MSQTWNNVLNSIKRNLGTKLNFLEISDEEIIEGLKDDALTYFSQYIPHKKYTLITPAHRITNVTPGHNRWTYRIPKLPDEYIIDILECYPTPADGGISSISLDPTYGIRQSIPLYGPGQMDIMGGGMIETVIDNQYIDMIDYLSVRNTWEFRPPDLISFDTEIYASVIHYNTPHKVLETIPPDYYNTTFKPLCLCYVKEWLASIRSKYENVATPLGEIKVNWQKLEDDAKTERERLQQILSAAPLDIFVYVAV